MRLRKIIAVTIFSLTLSSCLKTPYQLFDSRAQNNAWDKMVLGVGTEPKIWKLTLNEAVQLGIRNNLDVAVKALQVDFQEEVLTAARFSLVPKLIAEGVTSYRNKNTGAFSESLIPGIPPAPPSISSEKKVRTWDITLTWNLLDFGVSYFRARQEANKMLIQEFEYEREMQKLSLEVVRRFWKLAAEERGIALGQKLLADASSVLGRLQKSVDSGLLGSEQAARFAAAIMPIQFRIGENLKIYETTLSEFKVLLGLPPQDQIILVGTDEIPPCPAIPDVKELENLALLFRPELFGKDLQEDALTDQAGISFVQAGPELIPFYGKNYDGNRFLIFHHWWLAGLRASWNLLIIPQKIAEIQAIEAQKDVVRAQRLSQALGIVAQVNLAYLLYHEEFDLYTYASNFRKQRSLISYAALKRQEMAALGDLQVFLAEADAYESEMEAGRRYGDLRSALELINNTIGLPFYIPVNGKDEC